MTWHRAPRTTRVPDVSRETILCMSRVNERQGSGGGPLGGVTAEYPFHTGITARRKALNARIPLIRVALAPPPLPPPPVGPDPDAVLVLLGWEDDEDDEGVSGRLIFAVLAASWKAAAVSPVVSGFTARTMGALQSLLV